MYATVVKWDRDIHLWEDKPIYDCEDEVWYGKKLLGILYGKKASIDGLTFETSPMEVKLTKA